MLWSIDSCQKRVFADQYYMTISRAQVSTYPGNVFLKACRWPVISFQLIAAFFHVCGAPPLNVMHRKIPKIRPGAYYRGTLETKLGLRACRCSHSRSSRNKCLLPLLTTLRLLERPSRDGCRSALWDCFGGRICRHVENSFSQTVPQCTLKPSWLGLPRNRKVAHGKTLIQVHQISIPPVTVLRIFLLVWSKFCFCMCGSEANDF